MKHILLFVLLSLISLNAISDQTITPLAVGNYWKFVDDKANEEFAVVLEKIEVNGETWFKYRELDDEDTFYVNNSDQGQIEIDIASNEKHLVLKFPVSKKEIYSQFGQKISVTPNVEITVPAGTFNTYLYDFSIDSPEHPIQAWYAPGVGLVQQSYDGITFKLIEFNIQ
ncbi:MAG: hypothetical protein COA90_10065 [Gammaproteobacteria bacterium]|nr:MAG: hypothetical protein COA90_10065 [Gammaproteobacteria bacterium]